MKSLIKLFRWLSLVFIGFLGFVSWIQPALAERLPAQPVMIQATEIALNTATELCVEGPKVDLNNANISAFTDCPGFYPTLAKLIIQHSPYQKVEDVLNISDLNDRQRELLQRNLDNFQVSPPVVSLGERMPPRPMMRK
uniref:Photosystem II oxygen evolving complex protein PsbU n=1 Tax=Cyanothece sp. (strain PCC 7425 / ATCC 29141) TaxID=395961 RepID=B8HJQ2_CYAP4